MTSLPGESPAAASDVLQAKNPELAELCQEMSPEYRTLVEGEATAREITFLSPRIPGQLRHLGWVEDYLKQHDYTDERKAQKYRMMELRQQLVEQRRQAGEVRLKVLIGIGALEYFGDFAAPQARLLREAAHKENVELYAVPGGDLCIAMIRMHMGVELVSSTALSNYCESGPMVYGEYPYRVNRPETPHERLFMGGKYYEQHQDTASRMIEMALPQEEMLQVFDSYAKFTS